MSSRTMGMQPLPLGLQALQEGTRRFNTLGTVLPADHHPSYAYADATRASYGDSYYSTTR